MMNWQKTVLISLIVLPSGLAADRAEHAIDNMTESTTRWSIHAGPAEWQSDHPEQVIGNFEVRAPANEPSAGEPLIEALPMHGGACMVADLVPFGIGNATCQAHADCNQPGAFDSLSTSGAGQYFGYCAARDGSGEPPRCWTRPGPPGTYCKRTIDSWQMRAGMHAIGPVNGNPLGDQAPYPEWAVYACLAHPGHDRACAEPDNPHKQVSLTPVPSKGN